MDALACPGGLQPRPGRLSPWRRDFITPTLLSVHRRLVPAGRMPRLRSGEQHPRELRYKVVRTSASASSASSAGHRTPDSTRAYGCCQADALSNGRPSARPGSASATLKAGTLRIGPSESRTEPPPAPTETAPMEASP
jgi:hypothetical protein